MKNNICEYCNVIKQKRGYQDVGEYYGKRFDTEQVNGDIRINSVYEDELFFLIFDTSGGEYGNGQTRINYCPICGRKLDIEEDEE